VPADGQRGAVRPRAPAGPGQEGSAPAERRPAGTPADLAAAAHWTPAAVRAYGRDEQMDLAGVSCLWYGCLGTIPVRVILARDRRGILALVTTDPHTSPALMISRYAARWSIEQAFHDIRNTLGGGEARNRVRLAVERTVPFTMLVHTLIVIWYARHGHDPAGIDDRRRDQPWYKTRTEPAFEDMLIKLRRVMITATISRARRSRPTPEEIKAVLAAWHAAAA
jgi:hypothetical protein